MTPLLEVRDLSIVLTLDGVEKSVVHSVDFDLAAGQALGLVGESGAGKSMTLRSTLRMLPSVARAEGAVRFDGRDVYSFDDGELRRYRADDVGVIFQDPRAHLNPVRRVGDFLVEPLVSLRGMGKKEAAAKVTAVLEEIGVPDGEHRFRQYPHELSGGLLQRMMIAAVVAMEPRLILADEPTTALDVTTQSDVMAILDDLRRSHEMSLLLVTHDLDLAAAVCDRLAVMYAGSIVEEGPAAELVEEPLHPYSAGLGASRPGAAAPGGLLRAIPGRPLSAFEVPAGCPFAPRCEFAEERCRETRPPLEELGSSRVACLRAEELREHGGIRAGEVSRG
jgi:peptide/nickel transport system ATP-binding protein